MPANVLVLPFLAGFWFVHFCHYFHFRSKRLEGNRLLLESAVAGAFLFLGARVVTFVVQFFGWGNRWTQRWHDFAPLDFSGTAVGAFLLGIAAPFIVNFFFSKEKALRRSILKHGSSLLRILDKASYEARAVALTLDSRKVYIGYVLRVPNLDPLDTHLELLPMLSGYRDDKTLELRFTTDYTRVFALPGSDPKKFAIALPLNAIKTAGFFDPAQYPAFEIEEESLSVDPNQDNLPLTDDMPE